MVRYGNGGVKSSCLIDFESQLSGLPGRLDLQFLRYVDHQRFLTQALPSSAAPMPANFEVAETRVTLSYGKI